MRVLESGGCVVIMKKFDAAAALDAIQRYRVTHSQWVPTMFIRLLALPDEVKARYDLSSLRYAIHAAAPCPPDVKRRMIDWWGPVICEYYAGSEAVGTTALDSAEWLAHPGSVGRPIIGRVHILDDEGRELGPQQGGRIFFSGGGPAFEYHNDADKTGQSRDAQGRVTYGDLGHVDEDGYLYISGRRTDLILSGGVNIYPQEIENVLATHPAIADVAVIGVRNAEFGEEVKAVVELPPGAKGSPALADEIMAYCRARLSHLKCPRSVDFIASLPRLENGKLLKRLLRDRYEQGQTASQIEADLK
jgi:long-chain acyl-CoA synthetase